MTPAQCRAARALLNWTQPKLANVAGFGLSTIVDYEKERRVVSQTAIARMAEALEVGGVVFTPENGNGPGVAMRKSKNG